MSTAADSNARRTANPASAIRKSLEPLDTRLDGLYAQTVQTGISDQKISKAIEELRLELSSQASNNSAARKEVEDTMAQMFDEVEDGIGAQVKDLIDTELNTLVEAEVNRLLEEFIPAGDIEALVTDRAKLKARRYDLHNAESRIANSRLSAKFLDDPLSTIVNSNGVSSRFFPRTFRDLRNISEGNARGLLEFYRQDTSDIVPPSRDAFVNRLLIFLGLEYQIVKVGDKERLYKADEI